jgi:hypothetical protein
VATAISVANLEAALGEAHDAAATGSWATAFRWAAQYSFQYAGLPRSTFANASVSYPSPKDLLEFLTKAQEVGASAGDQRRLLRFRTNFNA